MAIRSIVRLGHPALRTPARPVDPDTIADAAFQQLIDDLFETMDSAEGVGLAAPQVGEEIQLFVYRTVDPDAAAEGAAAEDSDADDTEDESARRVLINPMVEPVAGELVYDWEGCLSIPDLRGLVPRFPGVRIHALDREGHRIDETVDGYEARIVQHEFDHLNGVVFLDRMRDLRSLAFADEWQRYMTADGDDDTPVG